MYHNEQSSNDEVHTLVIVFYGICLDRRLCFRILSPKLERELPSDMKEASTRHEGGFHPQERLFLSHSVPFTDA